jgi:hypothetical protein
MRQGDCQLRSTAGVVAVMAWRRVLQARVVQLRHRTSVGAAWHQPDRRPRQRAPAVTITARCVWGGAAPHRPLGPPQPVQLRHQRPGAVLQILQVAAAVERLAVDAARPAARVAGLRGTRTGVVGPRPAAALVALVEPGSGLEADLPGPARRPAGHQVSPPLAWLPGSDQPTTPAGTAQPEPHGTSTVLPGGRACRARSGCGRQPEGTPAGASSTVAVACKVLWIAVSATSAPQPRQYPSWCPPRLVSASLSASVARSRLLLWWWLAHREVEGQLVGAAIGQVHPLAAVWAHQVGGPRTAAKGLDDLLLLGRHLFTLPQPCSVSTRCAGRPRQPPRPRGAPCRSACPRVEVLGVLHRIPGGDGRHAATVTPGTDAGREQRRSWTVVQRKTDA